MGSIARESVIWRYAPGRHVKHALLDERPVCGTVLRDFTRRPARWMDNERVLALLPECGGCRRRLETEGKQIMYRPTEPVDRDKVVWRTIPRATKKHAFRLWTDGRPDTATMCGREPNKVIDNPDLEECQRCAVLVKPAQVAA